MKPFEKKQAEEYLAHVDKWELSSAADAISKKYVFRDFLQSMHFIEAVADIAEMEGHHPDISINYNKVILSLSTHSIGGLSENDFIVAAKIDGIWLI